MLITLNYWQLGSVGIRVDSSLNLGQHTKYNDKDFLDFLTPFSPMLV